MQQKEQKQDDDIIRIGEKPMANYIRALQKKVNDGVKEIGISARGKWISRAFDVAHSRDFENILKVDRVESKAEQSEKQENGQTKRFRYTAVTIYMKRKSITPP